MLHRDLLLPRRPKWFVPGVGVVVHGRKHRQHVGDGAGPIQFSIFRAMVLGANLSKLGCNFFSRVLSVSCISTALT
jgi:hypothetical protein